MMHLNVILVTLLTIILILMQTTEIKNDKI